MVSFTFKIESVTEVWNEVYLENKFCIFKC